MRGSSARGLLHRQRLLNGATACAGFFGRPEGSFWRGFARFRIGKWVADDEGCCSVVRVGIFFSIVYGGLSFVCSCVAYGFEMFFSLGKLSRLELGTESVMDGFESSDHDILIYRLEGKVSVRTAQGQTIETKRNAEKFL